MKTYLMISGAWVVFVAVTVIAVSVIVPNFGPQEAPQATCQVPPPARLTSAVDIEVGAKVCRAIGGAMSSIGNIDGALQVVCDNGRLFTMGGNK